MPTKLERQKAARAAAVTRAAKQATSLSIALLRADAVYDQIETVATTVDANDPAVRNHATEEALRLLNTPYSRIDALATLYFGALYAVVEKWQEWRFADSDVDTLLIEDRVRELRDLRHAVFHADHFNHGSFHAFIERPDALAWTRSLSDALRRYLREFHEQAPTFTVEHANRVGW